jgi:hypothetical protein
MVAIVLEAFPEKVKTDTRKPGLTCPLNNCLTYMTPLLCQLAGSDVLKMTRSRTTSNHNVLMMNSGDSTRKRTSSMFDQIVVLLDEDIAVVKSKT